MSSHRAKISIAIIIIIGMLIVGYWQFIHKSNHLDYTGRVIDAKTQKVISGAKVSVETQGPPQIYYTDTDGYFSLKINAALETVHLRVEADKYEPFDRTGSLSRTGVEDIRLNPISSSLQLTPAQTPVPGPSPNKAQSVTVPTQRPATPKPRTNRSADLEQRKKKAREDLNYQSPSPVP
jgi:hypothetical protein